MKIHEFQAKTLLASHGVPVPRFGVATTVEEARQRAEELGAGPWVVKAQIHAGGRGKGGGVKVVHTMEDLEQAAGSILGMQLVTHQTGPEGQRVRKVMVEEGCDIASELYLGLVVDRVQERPVLMASAEGGMDIEEVAASTPEKIHFLGFDPAVGVDPAEGTALGERIGLGGETAAAFGRLAASLAKAFVAEDCSLAEINPLVVTGAGDVMALDAKINFDDNALYRHAELAELRDTDEEAPRELRASEWDLSYISMDGDIGCMVNGAGLAMATMDIIKLHGGEPANFLDVGGGATAERVSEAFKIILDDPGVKAILVNIFGGIVRCDLIAEGVIQAARSTDLGVPLVVRLEGNKVEEGKKLLAESGLNITPADDLSDAARKAVAAAKEVTS
ncbi:MAG: ADP-forming succinate--CoA ligase subunit beta [Planctomycetota bacterium]